MSKDIYLWKLLPLEKCEAAMLNEINKIFETMEPLEITHVINQPISFNKQGAPVTVREYILQKFPPDIRASFQEANNLSRGEIISVSDLNEARLKELAIAIISEGDENIALSFLGEGTLNKSELINEVRTSTQIGKKVIETIKDYALFMDKVITTGNFRFDFD